MLCYFKLTTVPSPGIRVISNIVLPPSSRTGRANPRSMPRSIAAIALSCKCTVTFADSVVLGLISVMYRVFCFCRTTISTVEPVVHIRLGAALSTNSRNVFAAGLPGARSAESATSIACPLPYCFWIVLFLPTTSHARSPLRLNLTFPKKFFHKLAVAPFRNWYINQPDRALPTCRHL